LQASEKEETSAFSCLNVATALLIETTCYPSDRATIGTQRMSLLSQWASSAVKYTAYWCQQAL